MLCVTCNSIGVFAEKNLLLIYYSFKAIRSESSLKMQALCVPKHRTKAK